MSRFRRTRNTSKSNQTKDRFGRIREPYGGRAKPPAEEPSASPHSHRKVRLTKSDKDIARISARGWEESHTVRRSKRDRELFNVCNIGSKLRHDVMKGKGGLGPIEVRWYYVGAVQICTVQKVDKVMASKPGKYVVFINSQPGISGVHFHTEDQVNEFIKYELERVPKPYELGE